jgi:phosphonate transport system substrate-binding protein
MKKRRFNKFILVWFLGTAILFSGVANVAFADSHTLVLGKVSDNPKKHYKNLKPMVDYVVPKMDDLGVTEGKVLMARDNKQIVSYLRQGRLDWITETVFSALIYQEKAGAEFLLRKWKKGHAEYHSILFARKDSDIKSLADLKGKVVAFEDPGSTSAYYIPASILIREGLKLVQLSSPREKPPADMVGYVFSGEEVNTSMWVHKGLVDVGAFANLDWDKNEAVDKTLKKDLQIFFRSKSFPRAVEVVRKDLDPKIKKRLKEVLLAASDKPEGKKALKAYQKTKKFDEFNKKSMAGIEEAKELMKIVKAELEY